jgi:hypothetical protein
MEEEKKELENLREKIREKIEKSIDMKVKHKTSDVEELSAVLGAIRESVPPLIEGILKPLQDFLDSYFSPETVKKRAEALAEAYKTLVNAGIPEDKALELASKQIIDIDNLIEKILKQL